MPPEDAREVPASSQAGGHGPSNGSKNKKKGRKVTAGQGDVVNVVDAQRSAGVCGAVLEFDPARCNRTPLCAPGVNRLHCRSASSRRSAGLWRSAEVWPRQVQRNTIVCAGGQSTSTRRRRFKVQRKFAARLRSLAPPGAKKHLCVRRGSSNFKAVAQVCGAAQVQVCGAVLEFGPARCKDTQLCAPGVNQLQRRSADFERSAGLWCSGAGVSPRQVQFNTLFAPGVNLLQRRSASQGTKPQSGRSQCRLAPPGPAVTLPDPGR